MRKSINPGWLTRQQTPFRPLCRHSKLPRFPSLEQRPPGWLFLGK